MKKTLLFLFIGLASILSVNSQIGTINISDVIPSATTLSGANLFNPDFSNTLIFSNCHGASIFNQNLDLSLIDPKTFKEKKKIELPEYKDYEFLNVNTHPYIEYLGSPYWTISTDMNKNYIIFYRRKQIKNNEIAAVKINESFNIPTTPQYLFSINADNSIIKFFKNDNRDLCMFTYQTENKKQKQKLFYYRVYNNDLKLIKLDSIALNYKKPDTLYAMVYNKGYALIKNNGLKRSVTICDLLANKTSELNLSYENEFLTIEKIKSISSDNIIIFGKYSSVLQNEKVKCGFFKVVYNTSNNTIVDQTFFDHIAVGKYEMENQDKYVEHVIITETGACYALISQFIAANVKDKTAEYTNKFELVYINSNSEKWNKQIPFFDTSKNIDFSYINGYLYMMYQNITGDKVKIDINNYVYGSNSISLAQSVSDISILKINQEGNILQQTIKNVPYQGMINYKNDFFGITKERNSMIQSRRKFFKITLNEFK